MLVAITFFQSAFWLCKPVLNFVARIKEIYQKKNQNTGSHLPSEFPGFFCLFLTEGVTTTSNYIALNQSHNQRECTAWKASKYGVFSGPYFPPTFGLNTERYVVSPCIQSECEKIRTTKNSVFGRFSHSDACY